MIREGTPPPGLPTWFASRFVRRWLAEAASDPRRLLRNGLLATLPASMLVISPERPLLSYVLAPVWLAAAVLLSRRQGRDRAPLLYAGTAVAFIAGAAVRTYLDGSLSADQRSYGLFKAEYFVVAVLPLSVGVALIVDRAADFKPTAATLILLGALLTVPTLLFRDTTVLGQGRYAWQGILMVLAGLLLLQFWVLRSIPGATALVVLCIVGVALTLSRQAMLAAIVAVLFTTAYWLMARQRAHATAHLRWRWLVPLCILVGLTTGVVSLVLISVVDVWNIKPLPWLPDVSNCSCALTRYRELFFFNSQAFYGGDHSRVRLLVSGWQVFLANPLAGAGLGSLDGLVIGLQGNNSWITYRYPHNIWLELAAEVGLPGLVVLVGPLVLGFVQLWRQGIRSQSQPIAGLLAVVCIFAVVVSLSGDLPAARTLWIFAIPCLKLGLSRSEDTSATQ